jgi:hypothetical protein
VVGPTWWAPIPGAVVASAAATGCYAAGLVVLGEHQWLDPVTLKIVAVVALANGVLALPAIRILRWTEGEALGLRWPFPPLRRGSFGPRRGRRRPLTPGLRRMTARMAP